MSKLFIVLILVIFASLGGWVFYMWYAFPIGLNCMPKVVVPGEKITYTAPVGSNTVQQFLYEKVHIRPRSFCAVY